MTDEEKTDDAEETTEAQAAEEAPAEEVATGEQPEADAAAEADAAEGSADAEATEADAEPEVDISTLPPKERRRVKRSRHSGEARPQRSAEDRQAERDAARKHSAAARRRWRANSKKRRGQGSGEGTPPAERSGTGSPRRRQGLVVSDKADKTITVQIDIARQHRVYGKIVRSTSTLHAHDERNEANSGDTVAVVESRPLSRSKRWRLVEILERAR